eukprot:6261872-Prymnesium_polylepis.3
MVWGHWSGAHASRAGDRARHRRSSATHARTARLAHRALCASKTTHTEVLACTVAEIRAACTRRDFSDISSMPHQFASFRECAPLLRDRETPFTWTPCSLLYGYGSFVRGRRT